MVRVDQDDQRVLDQRSHEAVERRGQLRISRLGSELLFSVAEGLSGEFVEIHRAPVGSGGFFGWRYYSGRGERVAAGNTPGG